MYKWVIVYSLLGVILVSVVVYLFAFLPLANKIGFSRASKIAKVYLLTTGTKRIVLDYLDTSPGLYDSVGIITKVENNGIWFWNFKGDSFVEFDSATELKYYDICSQDIVQTKRVVSEKFTDITDWSQKITGESFVKVLKRKSSNIPFKALSVDLYPSLPYVPQSLNLCNTK